MIARPLLWCLSACLLILSSQSHAQDPLPSWQPGKTKTAITQFVANVTQPESRYFVPVAERIAVFDNDGTLWTETPIYFQVFFIFDRVNALAPQHPEWQTQEPFASVLKGDMKGAMAKGEHGLLELMAATHSGMSNEAFAKLASEWIATAKHPGTGRLFTDMVYQPMLELLCYLSEHGFKNYIVSGGGVEFMRVWTEAVYGIPPEQVIGSRVQNEFQMINGEPVLMRQPEVAFINDKGGKPVAINDIIGRRPIMAFGNSDGDLAMLQWSTAGRGLRFGAIVHHTDGKRETAYDRESHVGRLDKALDQAPQQGWTLIDMKQDWKIVYPTPK